MTARLHRVLLIDDSDADNFLHRRAIAATGLVEEIDVRRDGEQGLELLRRLADAGDPMPELVLLDINMPRMTGWEFLEAYGELPRPAGTVLYVLSATANPADHERAAAHPAVDGFRSKSLTSDMLRDIIDTHFPDEHPGIDARP